MTRPTASLDLSWDSENSIIYFGKTPLEVMRNEDDPDYRRDVARAIFHQLVDLQNELIDLRRWKQHTDEWIKSRPADVDRSKP